MWNKCPNEKIYDGIKNTKNDDTIKKLFDFIST